MTVWRPAFTGFYSPALRPMSRPRPMAPPDGYTGWPLWYHRACLEHDRMFGWAYIGGLAAGAVTHLEM